MIIRRAAIRLAIVYSLVQLLVFAVVGTGVYAFVTSSFDFDLAETDAGVTVSAEQEFASLRQGLLLTVAVLLLVLPVVNYLLARVSLRPVSRAYDAQQNFVDDASHEFRTPIAIVQGRLELALSRSRGPEEYRDVMAGSLADIHGLAVLVDNLLVLSRGSDAQLRRSFVQLDPRQIVDAAVASVTPAAAAKVTVSSMMGGVRISGIPELLIRAVANLIENAGKHTDDAGRIDVLIEQRGRFVVVTVVDDGPGMSDADLSRAFDRFWQGNEARTGSGHGLGLALVRQITTLHAGRAELSPAAPGLAASIWIPALQEGAAP